MLRDALLTLHIASVAIWLGGAGYEILVVRRMRQARGTMIERDLIDIYMAYGPILGVATIVTALSGVLLSLSSDFGFFQHTWLGLKQAAMVGILIALGLALPPLVRIHKNLRAEDDGSHGTQDTLETLEGFRNAMDRAEPVFQSVRLVAIVSLFLAVWKPH